MYGLAWNEDWTQYFGTFGDDMMNEQALRDWIRRLRDTQITQFVMNPNGQRTSYFGKARECLAEGYDPSLPDDSAFFSSLPERKWSTLWERAIPDSIWKLAQKGLNAYEIWVDECKKCGIQAWFSMRMNDIHGVTDPTYFFHSELWKTHPEYRVAEYRFNEGESWYDRALDYARPEVREFNFALIREYITMYDLDGLELDLLRWPSYFKPGFQEMGIPVMNEFIETVRKMLDEKPHGHRIELSVRVPLTPEACYGFGLDTITWIKNGWIDQIVPMQRYDGFYNAAPYEIWKRFTEGTDVRLFGGLDIGVMTVPEVYHGYTSLEVTRANCSSMYFKGCEGVYLFNYIHTYSKIENYQTLIRECGDTKDIIHKTRRHIVGWNDFQAPGEPRLVGFPMKIFKGIEKDVRIHLGTAAGDRAEIYLTAKDGTSEPPKVRMNGVECVYEGLSSRPSPCPSENSMMSFYNGAAEKADMHYFTSGQPVRIWKYSVPDGTAHDGYNMIELTAVTDQEIVWVETELHE